MKIASRATPPGPPSQKTSGQATSSQGTLADRAYHALRQDIVTGAFTPGQPLRLEFLKERYGFSFSPLREALNRLQSEKLVDATALRGFRLAPLSIDEMWDTIETRILIECEALRRAMAKGGDAWEANIVSTFHSLSLAAERREAAGRSSAEDDNELETLHRNFHAALIDGCQSPLLLHLASQLYVRAERYRRPFLSEQRPLRRNIRREHQSIMKATLSRDARAPDLLAEHYRKTGEALVGHLPQAARESA
jgi:GntR family carbon starvation induced transcriptional regulator